MQQIGETQTRSEVVPLMIKKKKKPRKNLQNNRSKQATRSTVNAVMITGGPQFITMSILHDADPTFVDPVKTSFQEAI